jgi:hypothetical protein
MPDPALRSRVPDRRAPVRGGAAPDATMGAMLLLPSRTPRTAGAAVLLALGFVVLGATPASAHGLTGVQPTNFASHVISVSPSVPGLTVRVLDLGARIQLRNATRYDVVVLGYQGEPYLRVGPDGVFENRRSPAVFLNRSTTVTATVPLSYDARARPVWRRTSRGRVVAWHDHRVHWMGASLPATVHNAPGHVHVVSNWTVTLVYRGRPITVRGDLLWVPGPSALPRLGLALLVALVVGGLGFTRRWGVVVALALLVAAVLVAFLIAGEWSSISAGWWSAFLSTAYSILGVAVALAAIGALARSWRTPGDAVALVLVAAVVLTFGSGLADITVLDHSQLPTSLSGSLARTFVAVVLGAGVGVLVTAARKLRRPPPSTAPPARSAS